MLVFFDSTLVYNKSWSDHLSHLLTTFEVLIHHQLCVKKQKCSFRQSQVEYLGHIVSSEGVKGIPKADWLL